MPWSSQGITEGEVARPILGREGAYRRSLAAADVVARCSPLGRVALVAQPARRGLLIAFAPLIVLVNKIGGLYDRDELVMNKTTLDEAPALLQISGLFTLLVVDGPRRDRPLGPRCPRACWSSGSLLLGLTARPDARRAAGRAAGPSRSAAS